MLRVIHEAVDVDLPHARADGDALWLDRPDVERATGWSWKPEGLCRDDACIPLPRDAAAALVRDDRLDVAGTWRRLGRPVVHDADSSLWVLGTAADERASTLATLQAPDFELPDITGRMHRLSAYQGRRVFMVAWASWCGCRLDLPVWQALTESLDAATRARFTVLAIALDQPDAARPWIDAAKPTYPCLIDRDHRVAELYHLTNVPQAVWIDESGRIVRPPENAGSTDGFRRMDRSSGAMPADALADRARVKQAYGDAVKDWAVNGARSRFALSQADAASRLRTPDASVATAQAHFRLAQALRRDGHTDEAGRHFEQAARLHPESWAIWREGADKNDTGLAVGTAFWERVDALGDVPYHRRIERDIGVG